MITTDYNQDVVNKMMEHYKNFVVNRINTFTVQPEIESEKDMAEYPGIPSLEEYINNVYPIAIRMEYIQRINIMTDENEIKLVIDGYASETGLPVETLKLYSGKHYLRGYAAEYVNFVIGKHAPETLYDRKLYGSLDTPSKRTYHVWSEGFAVTGNSAEAHLVGTIEASNFQEACDILLKDDPNYDSKSLRTWGCKLYDNEVDARKYFG